MKKSIIITVIYFMCTIITAQTWETKNSGVTVTLHSVCFVDSLTGWAVGDSSTILKTINGGKSWQMQSCLANKELVKVQFLSRTTGYVLSREGVFLSSSDGGQNWAASYLLTDSTGFYFGNLCFTNEKEGWLTANKEAPSYYVGLIMNTIDGGKTWKKQFEITLGQIRFIALKFINNKIGWALAYFHFDPLGSTYVYKTEDGGNKWESTGTMEFFEGSLKAISKDTLWAGGTILNTSFDGGITWKNYYADNLKNARTILPISGKKGWVTSNGVNAGENGILFTTDAGKTWKVEYSWKGSTVSDMQYIAETLWVVGVKGMIMKRVSGISRVENISEIPLTFDLDQNYPNPFNPSTTITFIVPQYSLVVLKVYDILGCEIRELVKNFYRPGKYSVVFTANNLSSGIYFYKIFATGATKTMKMILQK